MMTPEQWARVKDVFNAAVTKEPGARAAFVAEACGGDEAVRAEVERLLAADGESSPFIESPAADALLAGRVISHYEIQRLLGTGGMGRVYAARDQELGREVALKIASFEGADAQARLRREAQHASQLSHPHICHIYEVGRADAQLFVVMELVPGRPLAEVLAEGPLPVATARRYGMEIADALAHAHERGVVHRDLKSTNVMISPKRGATVLDFGLARRIDTAQIDALSHSQRSLTAEGLMAGTLPYMAPELLRGQPADQRADIWALGVLLYEMVSGRRPFTGATGFELSAAILAQTPDVLPAAVPAPLRAAIQRCLEKNPNDRFQSAADVHLALETMKGAARPRRFPALRGRARLAAALLLSAAIVTAAVMVSRKASNSFSNIRGYSLLEEGAFDQAVREFEGVVARADDDANAWDSLGEGYLASGRPERALEAYTRALDVEPAFAPSVLGRGVALAALGRYDEALAQPPRDFVVQAFLLSRVGRYREAMQLLDRVKRETPDADEEVKASALLMSAWLLIERGEYARSLEDVGAAAMALGPPDEGANNPLRVFADLVGGVAEVRAGIIAAATSRLDAVRARHDGSERLEANWVAALEAEIALARGQPDRATAAFEAAQAPVWINLSDDTSAVFVVSPPWRDLPARVAVARGDHAAAIAAFRRLTAAADRESSAALEPRHVVALARLLEEQGDAPAARTEYERFLKLWARADDDLPELDQARQALARLSRP